VVIRILRILTFIILLSLFSYLLYLQQIGNLRKPTNGILLNVANNINIQEEIFPKEFEEKTIESEINNFRKENRLGELTRYEPLCELAKIRVLEIKTDWSHEGFEKRNEEIYTRFCNKDPIVCTSAGENLAQGDFVDEKDLVQGWEESPGHKENMLGEYNVQCAAVSETYYVSLFAYTENTELIAQQEYEELHSRVEYDYEKVIFWEKQKTLNTSYVENWKGGYDNPHYRDEDIDKLVKALEDKVDVADELWDGYTNSKITVQESYELENTYWELANKSAKISKELNEKAYENCLDDGIEKDVCEKYKG